MRFGLAPNSPWILLLASTLVVARVDAQSPRYGVEVRLAGLDAAGGVAERAFLLSSTRETWIADDPACGGRPRATVVARSARGTVRAFVVHAVASVGVPTRIGAGACGAEAWLERVDGRRLEAVSGDVVIVSVRGGSDAGARVAVLRGSVVFLEAGRPIALQFDATVRVAASRSGVR